MLAHRKFFAKLAPKLGVQRPTEWHNIRRKDVAVESGGSTVLLHYNNSLSCAMQQLFPGNKF